MTEFVEVKHDKIKGTALVSKKSLAHYKKAGWTPVHKETAAEGTADKKES